MRRRTQVLTVMLVLGTMVVAGCGGGMSNSTPVAAGPHAPGAPPLLKRKLHKGEVMVDAEYSPQREGPFDFHGRYTVRFAQYAPEAARVNFGGQVPFVAYLVGIDPRSKKIGLFHLATAHGQKTLTLDGRYFVEVAFGDFPYVLRFTPRG
jgi:hypothetical protein